MNSKPRDSVMSSPSADFGLPAEVHGRPDAPITSSIYEVLQRGLAIDPDKVAVISMHQPADYLADTVSSSGPANVDCLHWTYRQLNEASLKLATRLMQICPPGRRRLACFVWNSIEHTILFWAVAHMRGTFVPLDPTLLEPGREESRDWHLECLKPDIVVALNHDSGLEQVLSNVVPHAIKISIAHDDLLPASWLSLPSVLRGVTVMSPVGTISHAGPPDSSAIVQILFSSGTTSNPKPIPHSAAQVTPWICHGTPVLPSSTIKLATTAGFRTIYMIYLLLVHQAGATLLIPYPRFTAATAVAAIVKYRPHLIGTVPALLRLLVTEASRVGVTLPSLRSIIVGGDVVTADLLDLASTAFPNAEFRPSYSMTETFPQTTWGILPKRFPSLPNNAVSTGPPSLGVVLRICAQGTFNLLKRGEAGELWVAGQGVLHSYLDGRDADHFRTAPDFTGRERQWFRTGDYAMLDSQGHLYVLGRYKDVIVRADAKLSPVAMETALAKLGCPDAQVVGVPHKVLGSVPVAVVRTLDGKEAKQLVAGVVRMLGEEHQLENIWTLRDLEQDDWTYNSAGKISKTELQRRLCETVIHGSW